jgi:nucleotide-binding universal stress UspA family protein
MVSSDLDLPHKPEIEVEFGIPEKEIVRLARTRKADLIVMGSHSGGVLSRHLPWTTLHYVLQHARCPVLTVRGEIEQ